MVDSRQKGARAESAAKDILIKHTGLNWQRTPSSGALHENHGLKGDLYIPECKNKYCIEVKHYKDDHFTSKIFNSATSQLETWWNQTKRQADQVNREPLLLFKYDRSKFYIVVHEFFESNNFKHVYFPYLDVSICLLEDWIKYEKPQFIIGWSDNGI